MEQKTKFNIGFFFLSLGFLITLVTSVVSFLNLVFSTLNKKFPDVLNSVYQYGYSIYDYESIRMSLATLIIFFPIFLIVSYFWNNVLKKEIGIVDEIIKKWMIYIILFMSTVVAMVDMVTLVKYFIAGELTERFILKVTVTLLVAILVGAYFILFLKKGSQKTYNYLFASAGLLLVIGTIGYSFSIMGSPMKQRALRLDDRRVSDLQNIQYQIINYWQQKEKLPITLSEISNPISGNYLPVDPEFENGKNYEYFKKADMSFELCATFSLPMPKGWQENYFRGNMFSTNYSVKEVSQVAYPAPHPNESWDHDTGRTCFERTIDKDIYPPFSKTVK